MTKAEARKITSNGLKRLRKERKLTQAEVYNACGLVDRTYQQYERGETSPTAETLYLLADYYGVSIDYLLNRSEYKTLEDAQRQFLADIIFYLKLYDVQKGIVQGSM